MEQNVVKPRGLLFSFALAITIICIATALVCGGLILIGNIGSAPRSFEREYFAVGTYYDSLSEAKSRAEAERLSGRAGYVISESSGFFLVSALYCDKNDATGVAERIGAETLVLKIAKTAFSGEDSAKCIAALNTLCEVVEKTEAIWRQLDAQETSESLTVKMLNAYSNALIEYKEVPNGVGELCNRTRVILTEAATSGRYPLSADVKHVSVAVAALLADYTNSRANKT